MICRERKIIFVHIPKCGGTAIENRLWPAGVERTPDMLWMGFVGPFHNKYQTGGLQHLTARLIREEVGAALFGACFKFALSRHPTARIVSQFKYMATRPDLRQFAGLSESYDFDDYLDRIEAVEHVQWAPQTSFLEDDGGDILVDRIYRLEDVAVDPRPLFADLGLEGAALPRVNTTDAQPTPQLSSAQQARVRELYRRDFEKLGYG